MSDWNGTILGPPHVRLVLAIPSIPLTDFTCAERARESHLQRQDPLRPKLSRRTPRDFLHIQDQSAMRKCAEWKGTRHDQQLLVHLLTVIGRPYQAALLSPVEERFHHGDHTHRAQEVRIYDMIRLSWADMSRYMAAPQNKKLPQPPEGTTF